jgi:hypothetical protein
MPITSQTMSTKVFPSFSGPKQRTTTGMELPTTPSTIFKDSPPLPPSSFSFISSLNKIQFITTAILLPPQFFKIFLRLLLALFSDNLIAFMLL